MNNAKSSKQNLLIIAAVAVAILLIGNAVLLVNNYRKNQTISEKESELSEANQLREELEMEYQNTVAELDEMKGTNEELNRLIEQQQEELTLQKNRIDDLIKSERNLQAARREITKFKAQVAEYVAEISRLKEENIQLSESNKSLMVQTNNLSDSLSNKSVAYEKVLTAKSDIEKEKASLEASNLRLSKTVTRASVIDVKDIEVTPEKIKGNGKTSRTRNAQKVERIKVCFNTTTNEVAESGLEEFYVRIISPQGETLAIEELGSGVMTTSKNDQVRFTQVKEVDYNNSPQQTCSVWHPGGSFQEGNYEVEIYNKGYLAGKASFELK